MKTTMKTTTITLWLDESLPIVREGRGKMLARGTALTEGKTRRENADFIRALLKTDAKIKIKGKLY